MMRLAIRLGNDRVGEQTAENLLSRPAEGRFGPWVPSDDHAGAVHGDDRVERRFDDESCALLAGEKGGLRTLAIGHVGRHAEDGVRLALFVEERSLYRYVGVIPIILRRDLFFGDRGARRDRALVHRAKRVCGFAREDVVVGPADDAVDVDVKELAEPPIHHQVAARQVLHIDDGVRVVANRLKQRLAGAHGPLGTATFGQLILKDEPIADPGDPAHPNSM
jgi:hypothetical protein